jgi:GT2 family glycosyltransferase
VTTSSGAPLVWVIVLNYNGADHLPYCLPSVCATEYSPLEIVVVDNASMDGSLALASGFAVRTITSERNLGWSGGNNIGIRAALAAGARYVVLANNDIRVHPHWIAEAVRVADSMPDVGVIGFDVHEPQPGDQDRDAGYADACREWASSDTTTSPEYVGGMAMFVRCAPLEQLGLIDESFFAYGEENDLQIRMRSAGYRILGITVPVWHYGQATFEKTPFRASLLQTENNIQLLLKHGTPWEWVKAGVGHVYRRLLSSKQAQAPTAVERRLGGGSPARTAGILMLAAVRVAGKSPAIFRRRADDRRRIDAARAGRAG